MMSQEADIISPDDESFNDETENSIWVNPKKEPVDCNTSEDHTTEYDNDNANVEENSSKQTETDEKTNNTNYCVKEKEKRLRNKSLNMKTDTIVSEKNMNFSDDNSSEEEGSGDSSNFSSQDSSFESEEEEMKKSVLKKKRRLVVAKKRKDPSYQVKENKLKRLKRSTDIHSIETLSKVKRNTVVNRKKNKYVSTTKMVDDSDSELERIRERRRISQYQRRQNPEVRARERAFQNLRRKDPAVRERERQRQALRRQDPEYRKRENLTIAARRRNNDELRELENAKMALRRRDPDYARREREMHKKNLLRRKQGSVSSQSMNSEKSKSISIKNGEDKAPHNKTTNETCSL